MSWRSLEELSTEFDLDTSTDREAMRRALQLRRGTLHPDKTGGEFASNEQKGKFHRLSEALQFLDSHAPIPLALVTNAEMLTRTLRLLEQIEQSLASADSRPSVTPRTRAEHRDAVTREATAHFRASWIRSGVFASIAGSIVTFSQALSNNAVLGWIADSTITTGFLSAAFLASRVLALIGRSREGRARRHASWLLSEEGLGYTVRGCLQRTSDDGDSIITQRGLAYEVTMCQRPWDKLKFVRRAKRWLQGSISTTLAERIAEIQLGILIERGLIRQNGYHGLEPRFVMDKERVETLLADPWFFAGRP